MTRRIAARYVPPERLEAMVETLMEAPRVVFAIDGGWSEDGQLVSLQGRWLIADRRQLC